MKKIFLLFCLSLTLSLSIQLVRTFAYTDVTQNSEHFEAITELTNQGIMKGYNDDTFRPKNLITRAEFVKVVALTKLQNPSTLPGHADDLKQLLKVPTEHCFKDIAPTQWYASFICYLKQEKSLNGSADGNFSPTMIVNMAEAAKILVLSLETEPKLIPGKYWYSPFLEVLSAKKAIPPSIHYLNQELTREEVAEILWRITKGIDTKAFVTSSELENNYCQKSPEHIPDSINMSKVRETWLGWYNDARQVNGLAPYGYDVQLARTAAEWSEYSLKRGFMDHKRPGQTLYYDYQKILKWFKNLGLEFKNDHGVTFTENIGWGYYKCPDGDCTDNMIKAIRTTFDFFMSEKGKKSHAHYDSIMNSHFKVIGIGLALNPFMHKYYLTIHYGTEIMTDPLQLCLT